MSRVFVHALGASAGGGEHYLGQLLEHLRTDQSHQWLLGISSRSKFRPERPRENVHLRVFPQCGGVGRLYQDQISIRQMIRREKVDVIMATGNFGLLHPPVPQVLLNRNALYFSELHTRRLWELREYRELGRILARRRLAMASIRASEDLVVPTRAFGETIRKWIPELSGDRFRVLPHGFDAAPFLSARQDWEPYRSHRPARLLMVSHYNYFRNFETLFRALAILARSLPIPPELILTTKIEAGNRDHRYDTSRAAELIKRLGLSPRINMLGTVPREDLADLYRRADVVVCPSYVESFGHPLLEGMASGRPVVVSDHAVHREICGPAAIYFPTFDAAQLAESIRAVLLDPQLACDQVGRGLGRVGHFSWKQHFETMNRILQVAADGRNLQPRKVCA